MRNKYHLSHTENQTIIECVKYCNYNTPCSITVSVMSTFFFLYYMYSSSYFIHSSRASLTYTHLVHVEKSKSTYKHLLNYNLIPVIEL